MVEFNAFFFFFSKKKKEKVIYHEVFHGNMLQWCVTSSGSAKEQIHTMKDIISYGENFFSLILAKVSIILHFVQLFRNWAIIEKGRLCWICPILECFKTFRPQPYTSVEEQFVITGKRRFKRLQKL